MGESVMPCQNHGESSSQVEGASQNAEEAVSVTEVEPPSCNTDERAAASTPRFIIGDGAEYPTDEYVTLDSSARMGQVNPTPDYCNDQDVRSFSGVALASISVSGSVSSPALQLKATEKVAAMLISTSSCHGDGHMVAVPVVVQTPAGLIHSPSAAGLGSNANLPTAFSPLALSESKASCMSDSCSLILPPARLVALDQKSETNSSMMPICRICHMPEDDIEILISPCRCSGSLKFIHNTCLMKWLEITTKKSRKPPRCELCHYQYHRHKKFKFDHWRLPRVSRQDKILHAVFLFNLVIMIGCAVATVMCFLSDKGNMPRLSRNKVDLTTEEIVTLTCGVLFFVSFFIAMSVQIKARHTIYQLFVKFIMQNMEWEIDEYDKSKDRLYKDQYTKVPQYV